MTTAILIWICLWTITLGFTNLLFKKYEITYYEKSWQHTLFFIILSVILFIVYQDQFFDYFNTFSWMHIVVILSLCLLWLSVPRLYKSDYYTAKERSGYQVPKFFEVLFQDLCFLGGLLSIGLSPTIFGLLFFSIHIPAVFFLPKKFSVMLIVGSFFGGILFAHLQSLGLTGFFIAMGLHLLFWTLMHIAMQKHMFSITPLKR